MALTFVVREAGHSGAAFRYAASNATDSSTATVDDGRSTQDTNAEASRATPTATSIVMSNACT